MVSPGKSSLLISSIAMTAPFTKKGLIDSNLKFRSMTLPDIFIDQDTPENMYKIANLDSSSIEEKVLDLLNSNIVLQKQK